MTNTMEKLTQFFEANEDLRVFSMNGSKVNSTIPDDIFKDYDVVFFSTDFSKYINDSSFLDIFGDRLIQTEPESDPKSPNELLHGDGYVYLVQYVSGLRIDFQFRALSQLDSYLKEDSLTKIIADKDKLIQTHIVPSDTDYWLEQPTEKDVLFSITEFWWLFPNILKATLRNQLLLSEFYLDLARKELFQLMIWGIASKEGWDKNYGKEFTALLKYLTKKEHSCVMSLFNVGSQKQIYDALLEMMALYEDTSATLFDGFSQLDTATLDEYRHIPYKYLISKNQNDLAKMFKRA